MYRYETHLHTFPVSKCGKATVEESLQFYKDKGYDGVFVTNHFIDGNINIDSSLPLNERLDFYYSDYDHAVEFGEKIGLKVFLGIEMTTDDGTDFLVYGIDRRFFYDNEEFFAMKKTKQLPILMEMGALVAQAHPYREAGYIDHLHLFPRSINCAETLNACRTDFENMMANHYADCYGLLKIAGTDNHVGAKRPTLAGVECETPIESVEDFVKRVKAGEISLFHINSETGESLI